MKAILLLSVLLLLAPTAFPQCSYSPAFSWQYRSSALDVSIDGNDVWVATSYGVELLDRTTDPPRHVASIAIPDPTRTVRARNGIAYAGSGTNLYVIRKEGLALRLVGSIDARGTVNDLALAPSADLFAATSAGIVHFSLTDATNPFRGSGTFQTSSPNVSSVALELSILYAADGDSSLELFGVATPANPQKLTSVSALPRSIAVNASGNRVYVSDGQQTQVFQSSGTTLTKLSDTSLGSIAFAALPGSAAFVAGNDRTLRAVDFTLAATPVELFNTSLLPAGGTINRVSALAVAGNRLYAASGDLGLLTLKLDGFAAPFPVRAYPTGSSSSIAAVGATFYAARSTAGLVEYRQSSTGEVTFVREWGSSLKHVVHDAGPSTVLTSSGSTLTYWATSATQPAVISDAIFRRPIVGAVLVGTTAYVVLEDKSFWLAEMAAASPTPAQVTVTGIAPTLIARSGTSVALAEVVGVAADARTNISWYPNANFTATPRTASIAGVATTGVAAGGNLAAVFTFRGISVIDFSTSFPTITVLPQSTAVFAQRLAITGTSLLETTERELLVWNLAAGTLVRRYPLPAETTALAVADGSTFASISTFDGIVSVNWQSQALQPSSVASVIGNSYYRDVQAAGDRVYLFDGRNIDIFSTAVGLAPHIAGAIRREGVVDFAVSPTRVYTLSTGNVVTSYGRDGSQLTETVVDGGVELAPQAIFTVGNAIWVSYSRGCLTVGCEKKTAVLDPSTLNTTATIAGSATDVATSGTRAYALFDLPSEVRVFDIGDAAHPAALASRATEGTPAPVAVAGANGTVHVLGEKLYSYAENGLTKIGEQLASYAPVSGVAFVDQRLRIDGNCAALSGRTLNPQLFTVGSPASWTAGSTFTVPAATKSMATVPGRLYVLTDYSLEIWGASKGPAGRREAARR